MSDAPDQLEESLSELTEWTESAPELWKQTEPPSAPRPATRRLKIGLWPALAAGLVMVLGAISVAQLFVGEQREPPREVNEHLVATELERRRPIPDEPRKVPQPPSAHVAPAARTAILYSTIDLATDELDATYQAVLGVIEPEAGEYVSEANLVATGGSVKLRVLPERRAEVIGTLRALVSESSQRSDDVDQVSVIARYRSLLDDVSLGADRHASVRQKLDTLRERMSLATIVIRIQPVS